MLGKKKKRKAELGTMLQHNNNKHERSLWAGVLTGFLTEVF
jgi:hypothetical protein